MSAKALEDVSPQIPADDFQELEAKVYRTIEMYKAAREAKAVAERDSQRLREQLEEREEEVDTLRRDIVKLRKDREEIRSRMPSRDEVNRLSLGMGTPVIIIVRTAFADGGRPVEVNEMILDSAAYVLEYDVEA